MTTPSCRKCGAPLPFEGQFCPSCGTLQVATNLVTGEIGQQPLPDMGTGRLRKLLHQRYRLLSTVGRGGMGAVYVAQDTQLGDRLVAIKEMSMSRLEPQEVPQAVEQFQHEAYLLARLHHPNLPAIHEYFEQYGQGQTGPRSDIYSLGVTLHQMLTGHNPVSKPFHFPALHLLDPSIPAPLAKLVTQMLELDEKKRPASIAVIKQEFQKLLNSQSVAPAQPSLRENRLAKALASSRTWRVIGCLCAMIVGVILCVQFQVQVAADYGVNSAPYLLLVSGLSLACVGLAFLLPSKRPFNVGKGIVLVLLGSCLLLPIYLDGSANDGASLLDSGGIYQPAVAFCLVIGTALAWLGAIWIWRHANLAMGIIFGSLVTILGIIFLRVSDISYVVPYTTQFLTSDYQFNLGILTCMCQIVLGVITPLIIYLRLQKVSLTQPV